MLCTRLCRGRELWDSLPISLGWLKVSPPSQEWSLLPEEWSLGQVIDLPKWINSWTNLFMFWVAWNVRSP